MSETETKATKVMKIILYILLGLTVIAGIMSYTNPGGSPSNSSAPSSSSSTESMF